MYVVGISPDVHTISVPAWKYLPRLRNLFSRLSPPSEYSIKNLAIADGEEVMGWVGDYTAWSSVMAEIDGSDLRIWSAFCINW